MVAVSDWRANCQVGLTTIAGQQDLKACQQSHKQRDTLTLAKLFKAGCERLRKGKAQVVTLEPAHGGAWVIRG